MLGGKWIKRTYESADEIVLSTWPYTASEGVAGKDYQQSRELNCKLILPPKTKLSRVHLKVSNDLKGMKALEKKAQALNIALKKALFCLAYTGIYNDSLVDFLSCKYYAIWVENALAIKKSWGLQRGKSDQRDAQRIAQYAYRFQDKAQRWQPDRAVI